MSTIDTQLCLILTYQLNVHQLYATCLDTVQALFFVSVASPLVTYNWAIDRFCAPFAILHLNRNWVRLISTQFHVQHLLTTWLEPFHIAVANPSQIWQPSQPFLS